MNLSLFNRFLLFLLLFMGLGRSSLHSQWRADAGDGFGASRFLGSLNGTSLVGMFGGGFSDGQDQSYIKSALQGAVLNQGYMAGIGDGFGMARFMGHMSGTPMETMFSGGISDGFDQRTSSFTPLEGISFPIALLSFDAFPEQEFVLLQWMTESELNHDFFTVERSPDANKFETLLTTPGAGTSFEQIIYEEKDYQPLPGKSFYRLKSTDFDGTFSYSHIVEVSRENLQDWEMNMYPNPVSGRSIHLRFQGLETGQELRIEMLDMAGKLIHSEILLPSEETWLEEIPIPEGLSRGSYLIKASGASGQIGKLLIVR